jgi:ketosteroid isomerase-like protein
MIHSSKRSTKKQFIAMLTGLLALAALATPARAGDAEDITAAVLAVDAAYNSGNAEIVAQYLHPDHTRFPSPGVQGAGLLAEGFEKEQLKARFKAGLEVDITTRHLAVDLYGNTAIVTGYNEGTITQPGGTVVREVARFTEVWIKEGGKWLRVHIHSSPLVGGE